MTKQEYRQARRLIRANGNYALRWLRMSHASIMLHLQAINDACDPYEHQNWRFQARM